MPTGKEVQRPDVRFMWAMISSNYSKICHFRVMTLQILVTDLSGGKRHS